LLAQANRDNDLFIVLRVVKRVGEKESDKKKKRESL